MKNTFHIVLKELRGNKSQSEIAKELGLTQRTWSYYEQGTREPDIDTLIAIAEYFKVPIDVLVGRYQIPSNCEKRTTET